MPRNAAGVYSLPDPPRVPNTVIDSPDENVTRDDIASELTNSLDRNGRGGMLAPFRIADGTLAAPGLAFLNEPGTGLWRAGAADMRIAVQGADYMKFAASQVVIMPGRTLMLADGALATPALAFSTEGNTGLYRVGAGVMAVALLGANSLVFSANKVEAPTTSSFFAGTLQVHPGGTPVAISNDNAGGYPSVGYNFKGGGAGVYNYTFNDSAHQIRFDGSTPTIRFFTAPAGVGGNPITFSEQFRVHHVNAAVNFLTVLGSPGPRPAITSFFSPAADVGIDFVGKGTSSLDFYTASGTQLAFVILNNGGGGGRAITVQADANNPTLSTTSGILRIHDAGASAGICQFRTLNANTGYTMYLTQDIVRGFIGMGSAVLSGALASDFVIRSEDILYLCRANQARISILSQFVAITGPMQISSATNAGMDNTAQLVVSGIGFAAYHFLDGTAYYIGQNSGARSLRMFAGASPGTGVQLNAGGTSWGSYSDIRMKDDLRPIVNAAQRVSKIRYMTGRYKTDKPEVSRAFVIGQDVVEQFPQASFIDREGTISVAYADLVPLHGAAIAEHEDRLNKLEAKVYAS